MSPEPHSRSNSHAKQGDTPSGFGYSTTICAEANSKPATRYSSDQWHRIWRSHGPDLLLLQHLTHLDYADLPIADVYRAEYYKFSIVLKFRGVSLLDDPHLPPENAEVDKEVLQRGTFQVACDYLLDYPDDVIATRILNEGMNAPLSVHYDFFEQLWGRIALFLKNHPADDPSTFESPST